ncbi:hypothetical protein [Pseudomonas sp. 5P_3.1_Bac2]|uniref:hypothetical protein n=1 Tax=Pseudomonas sp. 5P_3.1_Bac2 TaxID=2971617 RepID=UPI0021C9EB5A|nr:hypothetical protein [Pseudomonas sp. 5P_3.1_Bac2]MCU1717347.1 hypothetical protein [Pseudomonas sp. 5P_3.1_Bac2]
MSALHSAQLAYDYQEPPVPWIETRQGLEYLQDGIRHLLLGIDASTIKGADFISEFSQRRTELEQQDASFALDWALAKGGLAPIKYAELARDVARSMLYDARDKAEASVSWLGGQL